MYIGSRVRGQGGCPITEPPGNHCTPTSSLLSTHLYPCPEPARPMMVQGERPSTEQRIAQAFRDTYQPCPVCSSAAVKILSGEPTLMKIVAFIKAARGKMMMV